MSERRWVPRPAPRGQVDPDRVVSRRATRRVGLRVAALSAAMVLAGVLILLVFVWVDINRNASRRHGRGTIWVAIDPEDLLQVALIVTIGAIVLAGVGAMLFARQAVKPLEESLRRQRNFVGDASHELRTPLAVLDARIQQLQFMAEGSPDLQPVIAELRADSRAMIDIVNDLLASVSVSEADFEPADLRVAIEQVRREMALPAEESGVDLRVAESGLAKGSVRVGMPEVPLRGSLLALVDNAVGHTGAGGSVTVQAGTFGRWLVVRVIDEGQGIEGIAPERVFERFARGTSPAGSDRASHGIGLALVHDVVSRHGGTVEVESTGPSGTVFRLLLPSIR